MQAQALVGVLVVLLQSCCVLATCSLASTSYEATAGDGYCDSTQNSAGSCFDGGDCCETTCADNLYGCGVAGFDCKLYSGVVVTAANTVNCSTVKVSSINYASCDGIYTFVETNHWEKGSRELYFGCNKFYCCPDGVNCGCGQHGYYGTALVADVICIASSDPYQRPAVTATTYPNCLENVSQLSSDYSTITSSARSNGGSVGFSSGSAVGVISLVGEYSFPILMDSSSRVFGAGARLGQGRIVAFAHGLYISSTTSTNLMSLATGSLQWLCASCSGSVRVGVVSGTYSSLVTYLASVSGFTTVQVSSSNINSGASLGVDVLVLDPSSSFASINTTRVREWVQQGGGLYLAGTAWAWDYPNGFSDTTAYPGNHMIAGSGVVFCGNCGYASASSYSLSATMPALTASNSLCALRTMSAYAKEQVKLTSTELSTLTTTGSNGFSRVPYTQATTLLTTTFWTEAYTLVSTNIKPALPANDNDVPSASNPLTLLENSILLSLPTNLVDSHPAAAIFPGVSLGSSVSVTLDVNATYSTGWNTGYSYSGAGSDLLVPVGLYANSGEPISVTIPQAGVGKIGLRIGCHTDKLNSASTWKRYPQVSRAFSFSSTTESFASSFGGLIFITVPRGTYLGVISVTISGAYRCPFYQHQITTLSDWTTSQTNNNTHPAPWAVFHSNKLQFFVPSDQARQVADPIALMNFWDRVLDADADLSTISRDRARPEAIALDFQISNGYMHSGYPVMAPTSATEIVSLSTLVSSGAWGYYHELGHNHQLNAWVIPGTTEVSCNLFTLYVYHTVNNMTTEQARSSWNRAGDRATYLAPWPSARDYNNWKNSPFLALDTFMLLQESFGWDLYKTTFAAYLAMSSGSLPSADQDKIDVFVTKLSQAANRNLYPYFTAWSIPVSNSVLISLKGQVGVWVEDPLMNWHGAPLVSATSIQLSNDTDGRANHTTFGVSFIRASTEIGNNVTSIVALYRVYLGNATQPRAVELGSSTLSVLGGAAGARVANAVQVSVDLRTVASLVGTTPLITVVAASEYRNAWGSNHVSTSFTITDKVTSTNIPVCTGPTPSFPLKVLVSAHLQPQGPVCVKN